MANGVTSIIPTSPTAFVFGPPGPGEKMTGGGEGGGDKEADKGSGAVGALQRGKRVRFNRRSFSGTSF